METPKTLKIILALASPALLFTGVMAIGTLMVSCTLVCKAGSICGDGNVIGPSAVVAPTITPSVTPTSCVAQTSPFVCSPGADVFGAIIRDVQGTVAPAPEPIYIQTLVTAVIKDGRLCAQAGPASDEITVKAKVSNSVSQTIDVVRADGAIQALSSNNCVPSRF